MESPKFRSREERDERIQRIREHSAELRADFERDAQRTDVQNLKNEMIAALAAAQIAVTPEEITHLEHVRFPKSNVKTGSVRYTDTFAMALVKNFANFKCRIGTLPAFTDMPYCIGIESETLRVATQRHIFVGDFKDLQQKILSSRAYPAKSTKPSNE